MTDEQQPEALRLAGILGDYYFYADTNEAAAELRRLYEENVQMGEQRDELLAALRMARWCVQADLDSLVETCRHQDGSMEAADAALVATYAEKLGIIDKAIENGGAA